MNKNSQVEKNRNNNEKSEKILEIKHFQKVKEKYKMKRRMTKEI